MLDPLREVTDQRTSESDPAVNLRGDVTLLTAATSLPNTTLTLMRDRMIIDYSAPASH